MISEPVIKKEEALRLAQKEYEDKGFEWPNLVSIREKYSTWRVVTNPDRRGGMRFIFINNRTGEIINKDWWKGVTR